MLISPDPKAGEGRIPSRLFELYVQYKHDTRAIVAWLVHHGPRDYKSRLLSIKDLFRLAEIVRMKAVEIPETIIFQFREAIAARTHLSQFFRQTQTHEESGLGTMNHEYFTSSLKQIYNDLCCDCTKPGSTCGVNPAVHPARENRPVSKNPFHVLRRSESPNPAISQDKPNRYQYEILEEENENTISPRDPPLLQIMDDKLGEMFELLQEAQEISDLLAAVRNAWMHAARGDVSNIVATAITNTAFASFEEIEHRLKSSCHVSDPRAFQDKVCQVEHALSLTADLENVASASSQLAATLHRSWLILVALKQKSLLERREDSSPDASNPYLTLRQGTNSNASDHDCLTIMLRDIAQHTNSKFLWIDIIRIATPVLSEVGYFLTHSENDVNGLRCCFGLQLLLESYKCYLFASRPTHAPSGCRLQALRFAQEAISSIDSVLDDSTMPCRCQGTLAFHLENTGRGFQAFLRARIFDSYFQCPWVSGSHVLELLDALSYYGLRLFNYRNYVGSILHVYNILTIFTGMQAIPLLESLCKSLSGFIFPGGRPSQNFKACHVRFMGGRLRFNSRARNHKSGCRSMVIPAHTASATAGFKPTNEANGSRFDHRKISLLHHVKASGFYIDDATWQRVASINSFKTNRESSSNVRHRSSCKLNNLNGTSLASSSCDRLKSLQNAILKDFSGTFPVARLNFFEVYLVCVRIISVVNDKYHGEKARPGQSCLCFVDTLLLAADDCKNNEHLPKPFGCRELVAICQEAMTTVLEKRDMAGFFWKGI